MTTPVLPRSVCIEEFRAGVTACLRSWSALRAAAESGWGGNDSIRKADDLRNIIFDIMDFSSFPPRHYNDVQDLQDNLFDYMETEFSVVLEDSSDRQVAELLWRMYESCFKGDVNVARQVIASAGAAEKLAVAYPIKLQASEQSDDDDDEDEDDCQVEGKSDAIDGMDVDNHDESDVKIAEKPVDDGANNEVMSIAQYASTSLFGPTQRNKPNLNVPVRQLGEAAVVSNKPDMEVDEDGFAPVSTRRRTRRN